MCLAGAAFRTKTGAPTGVLSAPAGLLLAQIQHHARNDILFTMGGVMDRAVQMQLVKPQTRIDGWSNTLVLATAAGPTPPPTDQSDLRQWLPTVCIAVTDPTIASNGLDGRAVLARNGLMSNNSGRVIGAANTGDVAFLLCSGNADVGLLYRTDVAADSRLRMLTALDAGQPPQITYACAINAKTTSPNARVFLDLLQSKDIDTQLENAGLGVPS